MERAARHCKPSDVCGGRARREASLTHACVCVGVSVLVGHRRSTRWGACGSLTRAGCVSLALRSCVTHAHPCHTRASLLPYTSPFAALVPRMSPPVPCVARLQINFFAKSNSSIVNGPPKLVIWDLATNVKLREYVFTNAVASCACVDCAAHGVHVRWPCFAAHVRWPCFVRVPRRRPQLPERHRCGASTMLNTRVPHLVVVCGVLEHVACGRMGSHRSRLFAVVGRLPASSLRRTRSTASLTSRTPATWAAL